MKITRTALDSIAAHAAQTRPNECCGILLVAGNGTAVDRVLRSDNVEVQRPERAFRLGHRAHIKAVGLECVGEARIAGFYHSHPAGPSRPSLRDAEEANGDQVHLILGMAGDLPETAAWRWEGEGFVGEPLEVTEDEHADTDKTT